MYIPHNKTIWESWYREQTYVYATNIEAARRKIGEIGKVKYAKEIKDINDG